MQERLHDCRAEELTHTLQPMLPQTPLNTKVPLGTAATFGKVGAKTYTEAESSRDPEGSQVGSARFEKCRAGFLALCLPVPMPAPALDTVAPPEGRSSLTDTQDLGPSNSHAIASGRCHSHRRPANTLEQPAAQDRISSCKSVGSCTLI